MNTAYILQIYLLRSRPLFPVLPNCMIPHFQTIFSIFLDILTKNLYNYILIISLIGQLTLFNVCCSFFLFFSDFFSQTRTHFHRVDCWFLQDADVVVVIRSLELQVDGQQTITNQTFSWKLLNLHENTKFTIEKWAANIKKG